MSKKYKKSNMEICEEIIETYLEDSDLKKVSGLMSNIQYLIENNLAYKFSKGEYIAFPESNVYRLACKFIQKYNKNIKDCRRSLREYEFGNSDTILAKHDPKIVKLTKYVLEDGTYFAMIDKESYCILNIETKEDYHCQTNLYFIGNNWKKWKNKFNKIISKYNDLKKSEKNEYILSYDGNRRINTVFKSFDQVIFKNKKQVLDYIDNFINNIPVYYNKYNTIPKLSILLHGTPGTGKSTFYKALAKYLNIDNVINITSDYFINKANADSNRRYGNYDMVYNRNFPTIYAIDDIDCICTSREKNNKDLNNSVILQNLLAFLDNPPTFDFTAKDGVKYPVSIVVATTNYYDKLDSAVKRFGRFDLTLEMEDFDREQAQFMCDIYGLKLSDIVNKSNKPNFTISPSKLQALCLKNIDNKLKNTNNYEYIDGRILLHRIKK